MNTLIIYMSHHGTTRKIVRQLQEKLGKEETMIAELEQEQLPDLNSFSTILIGGSIHMGQIQPAIKRFCSENMTLLLEKRIGLFLCFMNKEQGQREFENAFPAELRNHAVANGLFGGELLLDQMNFIEKLVVKKISHVHENVTEINEEAVESFWQALCD